MTPFEDKKFLQHAECKRRISLELMHEMRKRKPRARKFIDLFGGTGAMSFSALQLGYNVQYNEFDDGIFSFTRKVVFGRYTPLTLKRMNGDHLPPEDWYEQTQSELSIFGVLPEDWYYLNLQLENVVVGLSPNNILSFFGNKSYDEIDLTQFNNEDVIVYCDIRNLRNSPYHKFHNPYQYIDIYDYEDVVFDYDKFEEWLKEQRNKGYDVFVSEYTQPKNTTEIWSITTQSNMGSAENKKEVKRLFVN